jgi:hypothetical protein
MPVDIQRPDEGNDREEKEGCVTYIIIFRGLVSNYCVSIPFLKLMMLTSADYCLHATRKSEQ